MLVMAQLSLSLMMLTAAGLFVHSAVRAANIHPGFSLENQVLAEVDASLINYDEARGSQLYATLKDRLRQAPGVQSVAIGATVPFGMFQLGKNITPSDSGGFERAPGAGRALQHRERRLFPRRWRFRCCAGGLLRRGERAGIEEQRRDYRQAGGREAVAGRRCAGQAHSHRQA